MAIQKPYAPTFGRKILFGVISVTIGILTFQKVSEISGPAFEPIIEACTNSDIPIEKFAAQTGYHDYEPKVGLGVFNVLVCIITQFLLELRETYPAGLLVWGSIIVVSFAASFILQFEAGREDAKRFSPIRFPIIVGLLFQLFGISVMFPLIWVPAYVFGHGLGPVSKLRLQCLIPQLLPGVILTGIVFISNTDSYLWTCAAGMLGGPILVLSPIIFWKNQNPAQTKENSEATLRGIRTSTKFITPIATVMWYALVFVAFQVYGSFGELWGGIWLNAGPSVRFMTVDAIILYVATLLWVTFHSEYVAFKALLLSLVIGPAGLLMVLGEIEEMKLDSVDFDGKKKDI